MSTDSEDSAIKTALRPFIFQCPGLRSKTFTIFLLLNQWNFYGSPTFMFMTAWVFEARHCPTLLNEIKKTKLQTYTSPQAVINILLWAVLFRHVLFYSQDALNLYVVC